MWALLKPLRMAGLTALRAVGEMSANAHAPAIINAIYDAVGVRLTALPATPEKVLRALVEKEAA